MAASTAPPRSQPSPRLLSLLLTAQVTLPRTEIAPAIAA